MKLRQLYSLQSFSLTDDFFRVAVVARAEVLARGFARVFEADAFLAANLKFP